IIAELKANRNGTPKDLLSGTKEILVADKNYAVAWTACRNESYCSPGSTYFDIEVSQNNHRIYEVGVLISAQR
ncbi:MAG: hypothetical protein DCC75_00530, partial [Proteobacteria bacterium]